MESIGKSPLPMSLFRRCRISRQALRSAFIEKAWPRWLTLVVVLMVGTLIIMTPDERALVATKALPLVGCSSSALLIGAAIGWLKSSRQWWLWSTAALGVLTLSLAAQVCWPNG